MEVIYFLTIIDDYSKRIWIYVLKNKSDTFEKFKEWYAQIEAQMGTKLKCLRTDNGLEFVSEQFNKFCRKLGIQRHNNGLAERMNRTILESVRYMLLSIGLLKKFWGCPSSAIGFKSPIELWNGRLVEFSNLRRVGLGEPKCIISRDVIFDETKMAMMSKDQQQAKNQENDYDNTQVAVELLAHQENEHEI
ncbi:hypothetical protein CR513_12021, partial [Mucuna pruriens]